MEGLGLSPNSLLYLGRAIGYHHADRSDHHDSAGSGGHVGGGRFVPPQAHHSRQGCNWGESTPRLDQTWPSGWHHKVPGKFQGRARTAS